MMSLPPKGGSMKYRMNLSGSSQLHEIDAMNHQEAITAYVRYLMGLPLGSIITLIGIQGELDAEPTYYINQVKIEVFSHLSKNHG